MLADQRHSRILEIINANGSATVVNLAAELGISESTIRRDLEKLDEAGRLSKVHGGAVALDLEGVTRDVPIAERSALNTAEKRAIAAAAAPLVGPHDFVYLDAGTSVDALIDVLTEKRARYATDCVSHALKLASRGFDVVVLGGSLKSATEALVGPDANAAVSRYHFTLGFWGTNGATLEDGFTTPDFNEAEVKRLSMNRTIHRFVLADASKVGRTSFVTFGDFESATLITSPLPAGSAYASRDNVEIAY
jgi:DeoR family transcriptional regulator, fructose operon transcriptional repressor